MHELYLQWLSVHGEWGKCELQIEAKRKDINDRVEMYDFLTKSALEKEVGEDLAKDLIQRHLDAESKLPLQKKGQFIQKNLD